MLRFHVPEAFTSADVERLAALARLALTPDEIALFTSQLSHFLSYAEQLQRLDTSGIAPTWHAIGSPSALRPDEVVPCLPRDEALAQAPAAAPGAGLFKVPRVIG
jgi:aspartyl-tRNA(Asn)/glutamyl-tRNA(Gln) amidotransferase subunit C